MILRSGLGFSNSFDQRLAEAFSGVLIAKRKEIGGSGAAVHTYAPGIQAANRQPLFQKLAGRRNVRKLLDLGLFELDSERNDIRPLILKHDRQPHRRYQEDVSLGLLPSNSCGSLR